MDLTEKQLTTLTNGHKDVSIEKHLEWLESDLRTIRLAAKKKTEQDRELLAEVLETLIKVNHFNYLPTSSLIDQVNKDITKIKKVLG